MSFSLLRSWNDVREDPPSAIGRLDGEPVRVVGLCRIERELGGGGMSRVFVGDEVALDRKVVVKVLAPELAAIFEVTLV